MERAERVVSHTAVGPHAQGVQRWEGELTVAPQADAGQSCFSFLFLHVSPL